MNLSTNSILDFEKALYSKDVKDNNCLHYCYMVDIPEVRTILRDNGLSSEYSQRMNRRG